MASVAIASSTGGVELPVQHHRAAARMHSDTDRHRADVEQRHHEQRPMARTSPYSMELRP